MKKTGIYPRNFPLQAPESYRELVDLYLPRPISDEIAYENAMEFVNWLVIRADNKEQLEFLELVTKLINDYESSDLKRTKLLSLKPLELLNALVKEKEVTARELGAILGVDHSTASRILKGERSITLVHATNLGEHFAIDPTRFLTLKK